MKAFSPELGKPTIQSLAGDWRYSTRDDPDFAQAGFNDSIWPSMHIPQNWFLGGLDHQGVVWFRCLFGKEQIASPYQTLIFHGVDYFADVYLNGIYLGHHSGYFSPFSFDITNVLQQGENLLAVRVDSPYEKPGSDGWHLRKRLIKGILNHHDCRPGGGWESQGQSYNTGGIWNRVEIFEHGAVTVDRVLLRADLGLQQSELIAELILSNRSITSHARLRITCHPENFEGEGFSGDFSLYLPPGTSRQLIQMPIPEIKRWEPWDRGDPNLYAVEVTVQPAGSTPVVCKTTFGFRTIRVDNRYNWYINGQRYFPRGTNYIASQWLSETLFPENSQGESHPYAAKREGGPIQGNWFERDLKLAKGANLNLLRVHAHVLPPEFHQQCDRAGILVWQDFPLQWGYADDGDFQKEAERQIVAMVEMYYNHPSIVAWCCHNESPWNAVWMAFRAGGKYNPRHNRALDARLEKVVKSLDPTRHVQKNSGHGDGHTYPGWYYGKMQDFARLPASPFPTEFGAQALPVKESLQVIFRQFGTDAGYSELVKFEQFLRSHRHFKNFRQIPPLHNVPDDLRQAWQVWSTWLFHDFQPKETFTRGRVVLGENIDEFIDSSQAYQENLIQYAIETYRRYKYKKITGLFHFMFTDPWPAITWSVLDYWRIPKPSYPALQRAYQPVLPAVVMPIKVHARKPTHAEFYVVNDIREEFLGAELLWEIFDEDLKSLTSGQFQIDIPSDGVTELIKLGIPVLPEGFCLLKLKLSSKAEVLLGENQYKIKVL